MDSHLLPRGIRNKNPGNIRLGKTRWQGQRPVQIDSAFIEFTDPVMGLRALMKLLLTYHVKYQLDTVESIINRYAPPHENNTDTYIRHVAKVLKIKRRDALRLDDKAMLSGLARAIVLHENGAPPRNFPPFWYDDALYGQAADLALRSLTPA